ncbi:MAG TPA: Na+/H+ antiporter subunit C [Epsilonproteobacteria bacterium]|nr:Na+/H+ antiporter subunit C [Campylobacterota bacterium]
MEILIAIIVGTLTAGGIFLALKGRTFPVVIGLTLLAYAVNLFLFATGRLFINQATIIQDGITQYADPIPQALVLTAIVISFGMTAFVIVLSLKAYGEYKSDHVDCLEEEEK